MTTPFLIVLIIVAILIFAFLIYFFSPKNIILRRLKELPHSKIGNLQNNKFAKVEGIAKNIEDPLIAPLSKRKCVFYKFQIEKKVRRGKSSHWQTIIDEEHIQDFFIEQAGERVVVLPTKNPKNYYDYLVSDTKTSSGTFNDPTPEFRKLLKFYSIETENLFGFNKKLRYSEAIVEVGERITIAGFVKWIKLDNPIVDYNYSSVASIIAKGKKKILITDNPDALKPKQGRV